MRIRVRPPFQSLLSPFRATRTPLYKILWLVYCYGARTSGRSSLGGRHRACADGLVLATVRYKLALALIPNVRLSNVRLSIRCRFLSVCAQAQASSIVGSVLASVLLVRLYPIPVPFGRDCTDCEALQGVLATKRPDVASTRPTSEHSEAARAATDESSPMGS